MAQTQETRPERSALVDGKQKGADRIDLFLDRPERETNTTNGPATCHLCGAPITFALTANDAYMPLDVEEGIGGKRYTVTETGRVDRLDKYEQVRLGRKGHTCHFDTCSEKDSPAATRDRRIRERYRDRVARLLGPGMGVDAARLRPESADMTYGEDIA